MSKHSCVGPSVTTCDSRGPVFGGYAYAPSGEVLGHRGKVAKFNFLALHLSSSEQMLDGRLGKSKVAARSRW